MSPEMILVIILGALIVFGALGLAAALLTATQFASLRGMIESLLSTVLQETHATQLTKGELEWIRELKSKQTPPE